jgi:nucleoside-diphosphate-sugar epimerase
MTTFVILGGCGFIGRNLVTKLASTDGVALPVVVADKVLPDLAHLSADELALYKDEGKVKFIQANLSSEASVKRVFDGLPSGAVVVNAGGETKYSQADAVYAESVVKATSACAKAAAGASVAKFIELSTAQVYDSSKKPSDESGKTKPWTGLAKAKLAAEAEVTSSGVPYTILRLAVVYGRGDVTGLMPRVLCAATYTQADAGTMDFLWDGDQRMNTVHVDDVVGAILHAGITAVDATAGKIFNLADKSDTSQGSVNKLLEEIFGIKTGFLGNMKSKAATAVAMKTVAAQANDKHMEPWSTLCKDKGITSTHLTPFLDEELLYNNSLAANGAAIEATGFAYSKPQLTKDELVSSIDYAESIGAFPKGVRK